MQGIIIGFSAVCYVFALKWLLACFDTDEHSRYRFVVALLFLLPVRCLLLLLVLLLSLFPCRPVLLRCDAVQRCSAVFLRSLSDRRSHRSQHHRSSWRADRRSFGVCAGGLRVWSVCTSQVCCVARSFVPFCCVLLFAFC